MKTDPTKAYEHLRRSWWFEELEDDYCTIDSANEAIKIAFKEGQSSPKIKQLEWVEDYGYIMAETPFLKYLVPIIGGKAGLCFGGNDQFLKFRTVDEAKAAAQADFERRVKECLE